MYAYSFICRLLFGLLFSSPLLLLGQAQIIKANFLKNSGTETYIELDDNSCLEWGEVNENEVLIYRLESGENGYLDIQVDDITAMQGAVSLKEDGGSQVFKMTFDNRILTVLGNTYSLVQGDFLRIQRCSTKVLYFHNSNPIGEVTISNNNFPLYAHLEVDNATPASNGNTPFIWMKFPRRSNACGPPPSRKSFVELQEKLDAAYTVVKDGVLRFTYTEDYATVAGLNASVSYQVYDGSFQPLAASGMSGTWVNNYGVNWKEFAVETLALDAYYILEVRGINKNETYYLRFKHE